MGAKHCCSRLNRLFTKVFLGKAVLASSAMETFATFEGQQKLAENIFYSSVNSVDPATLVRSHVKLKENILVIGDSEISKKKFNLEEFEKCYVVGFGKAVLPMAEETIRILGSRVEKCVVSVPVGTRDADISTIETYRGAKNNIPDADAFHAAQKITQLIQKCQENDLLIVLISGGGSALLPSPLPPITLEEKSELIKQLSTVGATINELNAVRKRISLLKGGGIVRLCKAKNIVSLILSDVLGDPLDIIASGPTVLNLDDEGDAWKVITKYLPNVSTVPVSIQKCLKTKREHINPNIFAVCRNFVIGNNKVALTAAADTASKSSLFVPFIMTRRIDGEAKHLGKNLVSLAVALAKKGEIAVNQLLPIFQDLNLSGVHDEAEAVEDLCNRVTRTRQDGHKLCLLFGGESTVFVAGSGIGGRNQELALSAALKLHELKPRTCITVLSAGTDGIDGPTKAAGAVVNANVVQEAAEQYFDAVQYLANNDSYTFFSSVSGGRYSIVTGHTGTNVMDLIVILID